MHYAVRILVSRQNSLGANPSAVFREVALLERIIVNDDAPAIISDVGHSIPRTDALHNILEKSNRCFVLSDSSGKICILRQQGF